MTNNNDEKFKSRPDEGSTSEKKSALLELSHLCDQNDVQIFPRNGLLLGIVRNSGFLPNEGIDMDVTARVEDVERIQDSNWGPFKISFKKCESYSQKGMVGHTYFNGRHVLSNKEISLSTIIIKHREIKGNIHGPLLFPYTPGYIYQPWIVAERNYKKELLLNSIYHSKYGYETGAKFLIPNNEIPLTPDCENVLENSPEYGKAGHIHKSSDWSDVKKLKFYDGEINVPCGYKNILFQHYGEDCLDVMITKSGDGYQKYLDR